MWQQQQQQQQRRRRRRLLVPLLLLLLLLLLCLLTAGAAVQVEQCLLIAEHGLRKHPQSLVRKQWVQLEHDAGTCWMGADRSDEPDEAEEAETGMGNGTQPAVVEQRKKRRALSFCLPDLTIAGVQKGGTSALRAWLMKDAQACFAHPAKKELHYFDLLPVASADALQDKEDAALSTLRREIRYFWGYASRFRIPADLARTGRRPIFVDKTPRYFSMALSAFLAAQDMPSLRSLIMLRAPLDRIRSHYKMTCQARKADGRRLERLSVLRPQAPWHQGMQHMLDEYTITRLCDENKPADSGGTLPRCLDASSPALVNPQPPRDLQCTDADVAKIVSAFQFAGEVFDDDPWTSMLVHTVTGLTRREQVYQRELHPLLGFEGAALARSLYAVQLSNWAFAFPKRRVLLVFLEDVRFNIRAVSPLLEWHHKIRAADPEPDDMVGSRGKEDRGGMANETDTEPAEEADAISDIARMRIAATRKQHRQAKVSAKTHTSVLADLQDLLCPNIKALRKMLSPAPLPDHPEWTCGNAAAKNPPPPVHTVSVARGTERGVWRIWEATFQAETHPAVLVMLSQAGRAPRRQRDWTKPAIPATVFVARYETQANEHR